MRQALVIFTGTVVFFLVGALGTLHYVKGFPERPAESPGRAVTLEIRRGMVFPRIVELLEQKNLVSNGLAFRLYANYRRLENRIRAGTYRLNTAITPRVLLNTLVHGVAAPTVTVTIPEGKNMLDVAGILAAAGVASREALIERMRDRRFLRRIGVPADSMEGFLFPDTYSLKAHSPSADVLRALYRRHQKVFYALRHEYPKRTRWLRRRMGWDHFEIVTLASIVEKETGQAQERPLIAGVFLNRLLFGSFRPKLLQTDPTIIYGCTVPLERSAACKKFEGRIRRIHLDDPDNPYNTYVHQGLPPGPIANPGRAALKAVFEPKKSRYLYFVSRNDGTHEFSQTRADHERAVDRYQRRTKRRD